MKWKPVVVRITLSFSMAISAIILTQFNVVTFSNASVGNNFARLQLQCLKSYCLVSNREGLGTSL